MNKIKTALTAAVLSTALLASGCGGSSQPANDGSAEPAGSSAAQAGEITLENCGEQVSYQVPVTKLFANDGNIISIALAAGAEGELTAVSSIARDRDVIALKYGDGINNLNEVAEKYPSLENILAADPEVMFAGWGYGFSDDKGITPDALADKGIATYTLSEACRSSDSARGIMSPWDALTLDITNIGKLTGHEDVAKEAVADIEKRRQALESAPQADEKPVAFLFDSGEDTIFSSGRFGAPQAMMDSAGLTNALEDVDDTWTSVSWERLAAADPDVIVFVDYPPQSYEEKIQMLKSNPASANMTAVKEERFVNLPYAMWTSGPLNIDGAEYLRLALEHYELQPESGIKPAMDLTKLDNLPGNEWLR